MNIAIFTHNYPRTSLDRKDAGTLIFDFAKILSRRHKITILCPDFGGKKENYKNVRVKWFDYGSSKKFGNYSYFNPIDLFKLTKLFVVGCIEAEKLVKKEKIDYVLCSWAIPSGIFAWYVKMRLKTKYGIWYLGSDLNIYAKMPIISFVMKTISQNADNLFANSNWLRKLAGSLYKKECTFTPTSTTINKNEAKKIKLSKDKTNILFVARLEKVKGPDILLEACRLVSVKNRNYKLRIIGNGAMEDSLMEFVKLNNLSENIEFLGNPGWYVNAGYMKASDFLMVASRHESLPLVMIEAANFNLPVISSDVGDSKDVMNRYLIGEIAKNNDPVSISKKILSFIENKKYLSYKKNGKFKQFVKDYSLDNSVTLFLKKIENV